MDAPGARGRHATGSAGASPPALASYEEPGGIADMVRAALVVNAVVSVLVAVFAIQYLSALDGVTSGGLGGVGDINSAADRLHVGDGVTFWSWFLCGVVFIVWTHRTYSNLSALGATGLRFKTGWAIGAWLVPVLAIWRPKQIVNDTWRASDRELPATAAREEWGDRPTPFAMTAWWVLWVVGALAERLSFNFGGGSLQSGLAIRVAGAACLVVAAVLALWVVGALTKRQQERAAHLGHLGGAAVALGPAPERPLRA